MKWFSATKQHHSVIYKLSDGVFLFLQSWLNLYTKRFLSSVFLAECRRPPWWSNITDAARGSPHVHCTPIQTQHSITDFRGILLIKQISLRLCCVCTPPSVLRSRVHNNARTQSAASHNQTSNMLLFACSTFCQIAHRVTVCDNSDCKAFEQMSHSRTFPNKDKSWFELLFVNVMSLS